MATGTLVTRKGFTLSVKIKDTLISYTTASGGPFTYGETITGGTSSATGVVLWDDTTNTELVVEVTSGTFQDSETITGGTSGATATINGAPSVAYPTAFTEVARARDSFNVDRQRQNTEIVDFDTPEEDFVDNILGNQSGSANTTINLVPSGVSFQLLEAAMDYNLEITLKREQQDRNEATTRTRYYTAGVSGFNETDSVTDASTVATTFVLNDVSQTDPT